MKQKQSRKIGHRRTLRRSRHIAVQADAEVATLDLVVGAAEDTLTEHELLLQDINTTLTEYNSRLNTLETP